MKTPVFQSHEKDNARLAEELGAARARESEAESRVSQEVHKLSEAQDDMEHKYHSEVCRDVELYRIYHAIYSDYW